MSFWDGLMGLTAAVASDLKAWTDEKQKEYEKKRAQIERELEHYKEHYSSYSDQELMQIHNASSGVKRKACHDILIERGYTPYSHNE